MKRTLPIRLLAASRIATWVFALGICQGCATSNWYTDEIIAYEMTVESVDGAKPAGSGVTRNPFCSIVVGSRAALVWKGSPNTPETPPVNMTVPMTELGKGSSFVVQVSGGASAVIPVSQPDLKSGHLTLTVPGEPSPVVVEVTFKPIYKERAALF